MEEQRQLGPDDSPTLADGAVRTPPAGSGSSSSNLPPPSDYPTLADSPSPSFGPDSSTPAESSPPPAPRPTRPQSIQADHSPLQPGTVLAQRYEILQILGEGGMGAVYKARDRELDRIVALKVIRSDLARNPAIIERFKQELRLAHQVTHKNVIRIYDLGEGEGVKFITMEYIQGEDVRSLIQEKKKFSPEEAVETMQQICRALEAAHSVGVIHRDLKPQNIMRDNQGRFLVMDFGLARSIESEGMTQTGALVGTMEYMSPEQALAKDLDQRSDLFTAGLIFYELLTGRMPFKADSGLASLIKRTQERAAAVSDHDHTIPAALSNIVAKCLERDPSLRYQRASDVLADLEAWQGKRAAATLSFASSTKPWGQTVPWPLLGGIAAVLVMAAVLGWFLTRGRSTGTAVAHAPVSVLVADFENKTSEGVFDGTLEPAFSVALEGASFITAYSRGSARKSALKLRPGSTGLDKDVSRLVAAREGISVVLAGSIEPKGGGYRISAAGLDGMTGKPLYGGEVDADKKEAVLPAVGKLAAKIRSSLGDTTPEAVQVAASETFTATSLEAAHEYALGQNDQYAGQWEGATQHYLKAAQLDPTMGRAYSGLAVIAFNTGRLQVADQYFKQALSNIDRMSQREKFRTRGTYYLSVGNLDKGIEELSELVKQYPADTAGLSNLALAYSWHRDWTRSLEAAKQSIEINPKSVLQRSNYGFYLNYAGDFAESLKVQKAILQENSSFVKSYVGEAFAELGQAHIPEAVAAWQELAKVNAEGASRASLGLADIALYEGRIEDAIGILDKAIPADIAEKNPDFAALKLVTMAYAQMLSGRAAPARTALDKALATSQDNGVQFWVARFYLELGNEAKALALAQQLGNQIGAEQLADANLIEGEALLKRGKATEAIQRFRDSQKILDTWLAHFDLARAYIEAGAFAEAHSETETCIKRRGEAISAFLDEEPTSYLFPPVYYYHGRAQEGLKSAEALESYKQFLAIQGQGHGPLVADARRRLAGHPNPPPRNGSTRSQRAIAPHPAAKQYGEAGAPSTLRRAAAI